MRNRKNEKAKMIADKILADLPKIIDKLPEKSKEVLSIIIRNSGYIKSNLLKDYDDEIRYWWNNDPPESAQGLLRLYGLMAVGKMPHGSKIFKTAFIPKEIREEIERLKLFQL